MNLLPQLVNGLALGAGYALIALGWTVLLGAAKLVNFSHGQMYMLGAFLCWYPMHKFGIPYFAAVPVSVAIVAVLGWLVQRAIIRLTLDQNLVSLMIATLGFGYMFTGGSVLMFGGNPQNLVSPLVGRNVYWGSVWFTLQDVAVLLVTLLLFAVVWYVLNRTRLGWIVKCVAEDPKLAQLAGVNAARVYQGIFAFEGAAVAFAATMVAPRVPILTNMGFDEVIFTFVVVVLGGIGSVGGSLLAGFGLGFFTALFGALVSPAYTTAAAFAVLVGILVWKPQGLVSQ